MLSLGEDDAPILFYPGNAGQLGLITQVDHPLYEFYGYNYQGVIMNEEELASAAKYPGIGIGYGKYSRIKLVLSIDDVQKYVDNSKKDEYEQKRQSELLNEVINKTAKNNVSEFESDLEQNLSGTGLSIKRCEFIEIEPYINCNTGE